MSSIHYKFRATLEYKTLQFDGLHITGADLKKEICLKEGIKAEAFDLLLQNAHTKRSYTAEELIPRNSSIIVQRVPREDAEKLPKIQGVNTGVVVRSSIADAGPLAPTHMNPEEFEKLSEEDQIAHIKDVSTAKYHASNFQKKTTNIMSGPPPPTYTCNRCYQPGHWYKNCPMLATKRTTGIPSQELMETTPEDPLAMLHPSGKLVVPIMHWKARQHTKKVVEETPAVERVPPPELTCPLCSHLLKDAVLTTCCGHSFCADCISTKLMESPDRQCPGKNCDQKQLSVDALVPNRTVRQAAQTWAMGGAGSGSQDQEHMRFRIGLQPANAAASAASTPPPQTLPLPAGVQQPLTAAVVTTTSSQPTDNTPAQGSPTPFIAAAPAVTVQVPPPFSQPPPNMLGNVIASSSSSGDSLLPPGASSLPPPTMNLPLSQTMHSATNLPPIPGVGLPIQHHVIVPGGTAQQPSYIYNQPPPMASMNIGAPQPQIMDAWDAFLHRKDRERERPRKRWRSRTRSSSSSSTSSSGDDRRKRRERHDRDRRRAHRSEKQRDRDRGRDNRSRRLDERRDRDRERDKERDRVERDRTRENRLQPTRTSAYQHRTRDLKEDSLMSTLGVDATSSPILTVACDKRERSRTRSKSPQNNMPAPSNDRRKRKRRDRLKNDSSWRSRKPGFQEKVEKVDENEDVEREIADEEAIDGTLREVAEFVRVEANCDDDGIEFDVEETEVVKEVVTEAEDEKSVTDTEPPVEVTDVPEDTTIDAVSEAENEEPTEQQLESDATQIIKEDVIEKEQVAAEERAEEGDDRSLSRRKEKKHKKHKKHKRNREDDDGESESKHKHKRKKEKKEKREKRKKEKKHKREKNEQISNDRVKEVDAELVKTSVDEANVRGEDRAGQYKEEHKSLESCSAHQRREHRELGSKHSERDRKHKNDGGRVHDERKSGKEHDRSVERKHGDKSHAKNEKARNRSRDRVEKKSKEYGSRKKDSERDRGFDMRPREKETVKKEEQKSKSRVEKEEKLESSSDRGRNQRRMKSLKDDASMPMESGIQTTSNEETISPPGDVEQASSSVRKGKTVADVVKEEEPLTKKPKTESTSTASPIKSALQSIVKFKVNPVKKVGPALRHFVQAEKESTDVEEDKNDAPVDDSDNADPRMREAFSPPKLQRKKITLNLSTST